MVSFAKYLQNSDEELADTVEEARLCMNVAELATVFFLGDAIRRFWSFYDKHKELQKNDKVMIIHFIMFTVYMISVLIKSIGIFRLILDKTDGKKSVLDIGIVDTLNIWL